MEIILTLFAMSILPLALLIQAKANERIHAETLKFLSANMQVGGTPVEVVKAQHAHHMEVAKYENERLEALRMQRIASLGD